MAETTAKAIRLTVEPDTVQWPETHYVFVEKIGPFQVNAPEAWNALRPLTPGIAEHNTITGYLSLYKMDEQRYRAGVSVADEPRQLPGGVRYKKFAGGAFYRFVLRGPYAQLGEATGRTVALVREKKLPLRDDYNIEHYVNDPRVTPEDELVTEILFPAG